MEGTREKLRVSLGESFFSRHEITELSPSCLSAISSLSDSSDISIYKHHNFDNRIVIANHNGYYIELVHVKTSYFGIGNTASFTIHDLLINRLDREFDYQCTFHGVSRFLKFMFGDEKYAIINMGYMSDEMREIYFDPINDYDEKDYDRYGVKDHHKVVPLISFRGLHGKLKNLDISMYDEKRLIRNNSNSDNDDMFEE